MSDRSFASTLDPGTVLGGKYVVREKLGGGGMGQIFLAMQKPINRPVAVKILHPRYVADDEVRSRFLREAQAASQLQHPNTITIYDFGRAGDDLHYIAMEHVDGESLESLIEREAPLSLKRAVPIVIQIAQSLGEAHRKGIIHRDLKPDNVMIRIDDSGKERVKVLDFGIAKLTDHTQGLTDTGSVFGTPGYMAPEQAKSEEIDHTCDFYALTCCLYQMLTGETPYSGSSPFEIMMKHQTSPVPKLGDEHPRQLQAFLEHGMAKDPSERPQAAEEYIRSLMAVFVDNDEEEPTGTDGVEGRARSTKSGMPAMTSGASQDVSREFASPFHSDEHPDVDTGRQEAIREMEVVSSEEESLDDRMERVEEDELAFQTTAPDDEQEPEPSGETSRVSGPRPDPELADVDSGVAEVDDDRADRSEPAERAEASSDEREAATSSESGSGRRAEASRTAPTEAAEPSGNWVGMVVGGLAVAAAVVGGWLFATSGGPAEVSMQLESEPKQARIFVDGRQVGMTPSEMSFEEGREATIEFRKDGYETVIYENIRPAERAEDGLFATLDRKVVTVKVRSPFDRSKLSVDGESRGILAKDNPRTLKLEWPTSELSITIDPPERTAYTKRIPASAIESSMTIAPSASQFVRTEPAESEDASP